MNVVPTLPPGRRIQLVFVFGVAAASVLLVVAYSVLGFRVAVQGAYALVGLLLAATVYARFDPAERRPVRDHRSPVYPRLVLATAAVTLGLVAFTGQRLAVVPGLVVGYALVALQVRAGSPPTRVLGQVVVLFALSPAVKYLSTGFYFGNWDTFFHVRYVELLIARGTPAAIDGTYSVFPGLHALVGAVSLFSGVPAYDALIATGIVSFAALVVLTYAFARSITFDAELALLVALSVTFTYHLSLYAAYFFPQSLAVLFLMTLVHVSSRLDAGEEGARWLLLAGIVLVAATITHHLTFLLFLPLFLVLAVSNVAAEPLTRLYRYQSSIRPRYWLLGLALVVAFGYWFVAAPSFLVQFTSAIRDVVLAGLGGSFSVGGTYDLGTRAPSDVEVGVGWLLGVPGAYFSALAALFVLGIVFLLESPARPDSFEDVPVPPAVLAAGVVASVFVLRSPLSALKSPDRIGLVWICFIAFVVAAGLRRLTYAARVRDARTVVPLVAFVVVLGTLAPLAMPNDFYGVRSPTSQTDFSEREYESLRATAAFVTDSEARASSFVVTNMAMYRFGYAQARHARLSESGIVAQEGLFVYRTRWTDYQVQTYAERMHHDQLYVSRPWLVRTADRHDTVYDSGPTGVIWVREEDTLEPDGEP